MGEVISMTDAVRPKTESHAHKGHRYTIAFRPHKPIGERWEWHVKFTKVYEFAGNAATHEGGVRDAKRKIDSMIGRSERSVG